MRKFKKKPLIIVAIIVLAGVLYWVFSPSGEEQNQLITSKIKKGSLTLSVDAVGEVFAENLVDVGTRATGQIKELYVKVGDKVNVGDKIAQIDDKVQQNTLEQKVAELGSLEARRNSAQVAYNTAKSQYNRELGLFKNQATSKENLENAKNALFSAEASLKEADAKITQSKIAVDIAKQDLGYTNIIAPFSGTVVSVPVEVGQTLNAVQSAPTVAQIADLGKMEIKMEVSEADIGQIKVGDEVEYNVLSNVENKFRSKISSIDPGLTTLSNGKYSTTSSSSSTTKSAVYYYVKMLVDNESGALRIGMTTQNKIIVKEVKDAIQIPLIALKTDDEGSYALVKTGNEISKKYLKIGMKTGAYAEVLEGLNEGDEVVSSQMSQAQIDEIIANRKVRFR